MALVADCKLIRYGTGDGKGPIAYPIGASQQLYSGAVAIMSGSGAVTTGYLKNAGTIGGTSDAVVGMVGDPAGTAYSTGPGLPTSTTDGGVWANILEGCFFIQSGTGSDALSVTTNNTTVYYGGENSNGPIACATNGSGTRVALGTQIPQDPGIAGGFSPGANYWPIDMKGPRP